MICAISPARVAKWLACVAIALVVLGVAGQYSRFELGASSLLGTVPLFQLDAEANIPSWYSSFLLFTAGALLALVGFGDAAVNDGYSLHWKGLSLIFFALSIDETAQIHETVNMQVRRLMATGTPGSAVELLPWTLIAGAALIVFGVAYLRFLINLPRDVRRLFIVAGCIYVGGALGMELVEGRHALLQKGHLAYAFLAGIEELLEMLGVVVFIYAILTHIRAKTPEVRLAFGER